MARLVLILTIALAGGCTEPPEIAIETPLFVFNTYPANGATIAWSDLREVAITFSADLGDPAEVRGAATGIFELFDEEGPLPLVRTDRTNVAYDDEHFTLRVLIDPELRDGFEAGTYRLVVRGGLESDEGRVLPTDYEARFVLAR